MTEFHYEQAIQHSLWTHGIDDTESTDGRRVNVKQLRERLQLNGAHVFSNAELISLVLGTAASNQRTIHQVQTLFSSNSLSELLTIEFGDYSQTYHLGDTKAAQVLAILELARRLTIPNQAEQYQIRSPADAATLVSSEMAFLDHEELRVLCLDTKNHVVANIKLYQGTLNSSVLRVAEIFRPAITRNCAGIIICHNHPSGDPKPSPEDESVTRQLVEAAKVFDIDLVDHIIIGSNQRFLSLKERMIW
jgi:DNA repair protein RadC